jgi:glycosyltransferase involved in cell wall biosynthesis
MISVVIPCYNHGKYLKRAVDSVVGQTFEDWEIIIINDGSTDSTARVAKKLLSDKIRLIEQENKGLGPTRNVGFENAKYDWVVPLDADDYLMPEFLERCLSLSHCADIVYTDFRSTAHGDLTLDFDPSYFVGYIRRNEMPLCGKSLPPCCTCLISKDLWKEVGGYRNMLMEDWDFLLSCIEYDAKFVGVGEVLFVWDNDKRSMKDDAFENKDGLLPLLRMNHPELFLGYGR